MSADNDIQGSVSEGLEDRSLIFFRFKPSDVLNPGCVSGKPVLKRVVVLKREDRCGNKQPDLLAVHHRLERRPDRDLRFPEPDVAAHEPVHGRGRLHILLHFER